MVPGTVGGGIVRVLNPTGGVIAEARCFPAVPDCFSFGWSSAGFSPFFSYLGDPLDPCDCQFFGVPGPGAASVQFLVQPARRWHCVTTGVCVQATIGAGVFRFSARN